MVYTNTNIFFAANIISLFLFNHKEKETNTLKNEFSFSSRVSQLGYVCGEARL